MLGHVEYSKSQRNIDCASRPASRLHLAKRDRGFLQFSGYSTAACRSNCFMGFYLAILPNKIVARKID